MLTIKAPQKICQDCPFKDYGDVEAALNKLAGLEDSVPAHWLPSYRALAVSHKLFYTNFFPLGNRRSFFLFFVVENFQ